MAGLETIEDIVGAKGWDDLERRLPSGLEAAAKKMAEVSAYFKANPITFTGNATTIKQDVDAINKIKVAQTDYLKINEQVSKSDLLAARISKELSLAKLADARATEIQEKAQQRKIAADLKEAESIRKKKEAQNTPITAQGSYAGASDTLPMSDAQSALSASQASAQSEASLAATASIKEKTAAEISDTVAIVENLTVSQQLSETLIVAKTELAAVNAELKQNTLAYRTGAINEAQYVQKGSQLIVQQSELKAIISATNSELTKQSKSVLTTTGSIESLSVQLEILKTEYKRLNDEQRKSSYGLTLQKSIQGADAEVKKLSASIGEHQKNVGNYAGGVSKAFSGTFSFLKQMAYLIPGLGIAGVFNLAFEAIGKLIDKIKDAKGAIDIMATSVKALNKAWDSPELQKATKDFAALRIDIQLAKEGLLDKTKVLKEYNDTIGKTTGEVKTLDEAEKAMVRNGDAYVKMMLYKAAANIALADAAKEAVEAEKIKLQDDKKSATFIDNISDLFGIKEETGSSGAAKEFEDKLKKDGAKRKQILVKEAESREKTQEDIASSFQKRAAEIAKKSGFDFFSGTEDEKKKKDTSAKTLRQEVRAEDQSRAAQVSAQKELSDAIRDNRAALAEQNIQTNKKIFEDERQTIDKRIEAYGEYYTSRQNQAKLNADKELSDIVELERQIVKIKGEDPSHRSAADSALLLRESGIAERRKGVMIKYNADLETLATDAAKDQLKILESYSDEAIKFLNSRISSLKELGSDVEAFELEKLLDRLEKGKISLRKYEKEKKTIQDKAAVDSIKTEISVIDKQLKAETLSFSARVDLEKRLHDLKVKLNNAELNLKEDNVKKSISLNKEQIAATLSSAQDLISSIQSALQFKYDQESQSYEAQSKAIEDNLKKELEAIAASGQSKKQQEEAEAAAQGRAAAAQNQIDQDRRKAQVEQARLNKAIAIANIILTTSQAVIQAFAEGDPYTKAIRAGVAAVAGAAQLAIAISTPTPSYAEGTDFHPGGKARYAEAGPEWIQKPGQAPSLATEETIGYLPTGTKVTPVDRMLNMANNDAIRRMSGMPITPEMYAATYISSFERLSGEVGKVNDKIGTLTNVVKNKKEFKVDITPNGLRWGAKEHNSRTEYLNRRIHV